MYENPFAGNPPRITREPGVDACGKCSSTRQLYGIVLADGGTSPLLCYTCFDTTHGRAPVVIETKSSR